MTMNRRRFLATTLAAGAGTLILDQLPALAGEPATSSADPFQLRPLGKTGLKVSLLGMGTGVNGTNHASNLTRLGKDKAEALLRYAYDRGIRFFDCADQYGTNPLMGDVLKSLPREKVVVGTKVWVRTSPPVDIAAEIDRFRTELQTDYIDYVQLHLMEDPNWSTTFAREMDGLEAAKAKGYIRAHGASFHNLDALKACIDQPWIDTVHVRLNAFGVNMDDPDPAKVVPVVRTLHAQGKGIINIKVLGAGALSSSPEKMEKSITFVLNTGAVDTMIIGFDKDSAQIDDMATRVEKVLTARSAVRGSDKYV